MRRFSLLLLFTFLTGCVATSVKESQKDVGTQSIVSHSEIPETQVFIPESKEVFSTGVAAIVSTRDIARDHAIRDAQRKAIEEAVGAFVSSETKVENFKLLSDEIYSQAKGYISSYSVIVEGEEEGLYKIRIRAKVKLDEIEDDLQAIGLLIAKQNRPRVMVIVDNTSIETMLISEFGDKGFPLVDRTLVKRNLEADQARAIIEGDYKTAKLIGLKLGAEIVVIGKTSTEKERSRAPYSDKYRDFYKTIIDARTISTETGEIIASSHVTKKLPISEEQSKEQTVKEAAGELIKEILSSWTKSENVTQIHITNTNFEELLSLKSAIQSNIRGVKQVIQRDFTGSKGVLEIISETTAQEILEELGAKDLGIEFEIKGFSGNRIDLELNLKKGGIK